MEKVMVLGVECVCVNCEGHIGGQAVLSRLSYSTSTSTLPATGMYGQA